MNEWDDDIELKLDYCNNPKRLKWDEEAPTRLAEIAPRLKPGMGDPSRTGVLYFYNEMGVVNPFAMLRYADGQNPYGEALRPDDQVVMFDSAGRTFFEGRWEKVTAEMLRQHVEFFIHMAKRGKLSPDE